MSYRTVTPYIRWGTNYANAAYFGFPADNVTSWSEPRERSEFIQGPDGGEDSWIVGFDQVLEGDLRWIPGSDTLFYPRCTGWDFNAATPGVRQMLENVKAKNLFAWHPDGRNLLRLPKLDSAGAIALSGFGGWLLSTDAGLTVVTNAFDAVEVAWKLSATNGTGSTKSMYIAQRIPSIPGEQLVMWVDYKTSGLAGGANGFIQIDAQDVGALTISTINLLTGLTATSYTRPGTGFGSAAPANTVYAAAYCGLTLPAGSSGTIWFRNAMVRRDSLVSTFIDNPSIDCCWVDPAVVPSWEADGQRKLHFKIRDVSLEFGGY